MDKNNEKKEKNNPGRPRYEISDAFAEEWLCVAKPEVFINKRQPNRPLTITEFNTTVRPYSDVDDTARLLKKNDASRVDGLAYVPFKDDRRGCVITVDGQKLVNTFRPTRIKPVKGDPAPFIEFLDYLLPIEGDRYEAKRWIATLIARPDVRMLYGMLLISKTQGIGKSTLGERILAPLVGPGNVSFPSENDIVDSTYNTWIAHKRLAVVHEIYSGHSRKAYDKLKSTLTDRKVTVSAKYLSGYDIDNFLTALACSNSMKALHLDDEDRRWLVPLVVEKKKPVEYWIEFNEWLRGEGLGIILQWAEDFLREDPSRVVVSGAHAPMTSTKKQVIIESRSEGQQWAYDLAEIVLAMKDKVIIVIEDVRTHLKWEREKERGGTQWLEKSVTLLSAMLSAGLQEPTPKDGEPRRRFKVNKLESTGTNGISSEQHLSYIVANFEIGQKEEWPDLKLYRKDPKELMEKEGEAKA
jgi:Family of unknown function (DUF5906)